MSLGPDGEIILRVSSRGSEGRDRRIAIGVAVIAAVAMVPAVALAHVERASYWPDPAADTAVNPPAGGAVPVARPLFTALEESQPGDARVVCQGGSAGSTGSAGSPARANQEVSHAPVDRLKQKLRKARNHGNKKKARKLKKRLAAAKQAYQEALAAENAARQQGQQGGESQSQPGQPSSLDRLDASIANARVRGYKLRPSAPPIFPSAAELQQLRDFNAQLFAACQYDSIQAAVNDSRNNDRVVVMPGTYTEPDSRAVPSHPEAAENPCADMFEQNDTGNTGALSYRYQFHCPNQQNLIAVMGREPLKNSEGEEVVPEQPDPNNPRRDGIPDAGPCIRCNLQLEGSGVGPDDVVVDSGRVESGNGAPRESAKDIGIRADRADGFVLRNMTVRHSEEHDIYVPESDGVRLERFKTYFNGDYGVLTFVAQHHLIQDCDAAGSGDAAVYPGSSAEHGEQVDPDFDADDPSVPHTMSTEYGTEIRRCDMHHSSTGYSGTASNSVWFHDNDSYDNAMGFVTDVFTASNHPGYPQDSDLIENNEFYSNNFNPFIEDENGDLAVCDSANGEHPGPNGPNQGCTDVVPRIPAPVGTGMFLPGVNNNTIRNNHFWDNWRRGTMLFAVPDSLVCGPPPAGNGGQHGCDQNEVNTSHRNEQHDNVMGRSPDHGPDPTWPTSGQNAEDPNGVDFWWDQFSGNARNCWYDNSGPEADGSGLTSTPPAPLLPGEGLQSCDDSVGTGSAFGQEAELFNCLGDFTFDTDTCDWFLTPQEPQPTP
jgi:hypothetical protein